jgi:hypothetical protein
MEHGTESGAGSVERATWDMKHDKTGNNSREQNHNMMGVSAKVCVCVYRKRRDAPLSKTGQRRVAVHPNDVHVPARLVDVCENASVSSAGSTSRKTKTGRC